MVKAPKHEAEGVTIRPLESRSVEPSADDKSTALGKSPAFAATRPQHHCPLGNPTSKPAAVPIRSSATPAWGHARSARQRSEERRVGKESIARGARSHA